MVDGDPQFVAIPGTQLTYVANTASDVFVDKSADNAWYVLISGRWFTAAFEQRAVELCATGKSLPADFAKIPPDSPKSAVLASIPGTPEARESLIANAIPQTATVKRSKATLTVALRRRAAIQADRRHAAAVCVQHRGAGDPGRRQRYYAVRQRRLVHGRLGRPGPWSVATNVPAVIYSIPTSSPLHYVTYVRVYGSNGDEVYVGYTPGYYGTVVSNGVVVYGTGYSVQPMGRRVLVRLPGDLRHGRVFGYDWVGWTFGYGWGWACGLSWYGPWWGPWGYGYPCGYWGGGTAAANVYGRWGNSAVAASAAAWAESVDRQLGRAGRGGYYNEATGGRGVGHAGTQHQHLHRHDDSRRQGMRYNPQTGRVVAGRGAAPSIRIPARRSPAARARWSTPIPAA